MDNLRYGHAEILSDVQNTTLAVGDIGDRALMQKVYSQHEIDAVMHFSAYAYVGESMTNPSKYYQNNVAAMINLLDETVAAGIGWLVFSSSCATYGIPESCIDHPACSKVGNSWRPAGKYHFHLSVLCGVHEHDR